MMASECNVGDLVLIDHDTYIFIDDKAFMIWKGTSAVVVEILDEEDDLNISEFSKGRRMLWKGSLKLMAEDGRIGWCHAGNVIKI